MLPEDDDLLDGGEHENEIDNDDDQDQADGEQSDADEADDDAVSEEPGEGDVDNVEDDDAGADEGKAGRSAEVEGKQPSRAQRAVLKAKADAKAAREETAALKQRLDAYEAGQQRQQTAQQRAEEAARIELMTPEERTEFLVNKTRQEFGNELSSLKFQMADSGDRSAFDALCARKPHFDAFRDDVEAELNRMRRNGGNAPRETIALYLLGKRADQRASKGGKQQRKQGAERLARQVAKPTGGKSDVSNRGQRPTDAAARKKRLEGLNI